MRCQTCGDATSPEFNDCQNCHTPLGQPAVTPGLPTYPVRRIGLAACVAVGVVTVAYLAVALGPVLALALAEQAAAERDSDVLLGAAVLEGVLGLIFILLQVAAGVLVIIWTWRARKNTDAFPGALPTLRAGWAIAGWLVPFANLVVPARVVANIARDSLRRRRTPGLVAVWWTAWLVFGVGDQVVSLNDEGKYARLPETPATAGEFRQYVDYYQGAQPRHFVPLVACVVAAVAFVVLVRRISAAQQDRLDRAAPAWQVAPDLARSAGHPYPPVTPPSPQVPADTPPASPPVPPGAGGTIGA